MAETGAVETDNKIRQLVCAASIGEYITIFTLHKQNVDINGYFRGMTALFSAASKGYVTTAQTLLDCGANPDAQTQPHGLTALQLHL